MAAREGKQVVLASVVALEGSSYRRPGVRMLLLEDGGMTGAVSGGCVEKEIFRQSESVFRTGIPKMMTYDGRYRLGCEGILYILLEPFRPAKGWLDTFRACMEARDPFRLVSQFDAQHGSGEHYGSFFLYKGQKLPLRVGLEEMENLSKFEETLAPCFRLIILGAEHDVVQLCGYAAMTGWDVIVVATPSEEKSPADFPGAAELHQTVPESWDPSGIDSHTAVVLMTHSFVKDLKFLLALKATEPAYLGVLGPAARREKLLHEFLEHCPDVSDRFFENIHGPAGLNIGAETPQEIAISILAEILSVVRGQKPMRLMHKKGAIHS